jgi:hypothetical protein
MKTQMPPKKKKGADDFQTPIGVFKPIMEYIPQEYLIWEPAMGKGNIVQEFTDNGYNIFGTDIMTGHNFLEYQPERFDITITNPPFSIKDKWIKRCYELEKPWVLLLPLTALEGQSRQTLYRKYGVNVFLPFKRINYHTPSGQGKGSWFPSCILTWKLDVPKNLMFI